MKHKVYAYKKRTSSRTTYGIIKASCVFRAALRLVKNPVNTDVDVIAHKFTYANHKGHNVTLHTLG